MSIPAKSFRLAFRAIFIVGCTLLAPPVWAQQLAAIDANDFPILVSDSNTGYIDNAIIGNQIRLRFESAFDIDRPDRGEFFYAKCGCFREAGADPSAPGPANRLNGRNPATTRFVETSLDAYSLTLGGEYALRKDFSLFLDLPFAALDAEVNDNTQGLGDLQFGFKYALFASSQRHLTLQLRAYAPSGDSERGLGTDHWSVEPGLLYFDQLSPRTTVAAELRYFHSIGGSSGLGTGFSEDFASDILRYGIGVSYDLNPGSKINVTPVVELVGWHLFNGLVSSSTDGTGATLVLNKAKGQDIVNLKVGARLRWSRKDSLYMGVGVALTNEDWYESIVRVAYRRTF